MTLFIYIAKPENDYLQGRPLMVITCKAREDCVARAVVLGYGFNTNHRWEWKNDYE